METAPGMTFLDLTALLLGLAAVFGYVNFRFFKLPHTIGLTVITLIFSAGALLADALFPGFEIERFAHALVGRMDFSRTLLQGMLSFLLFAGALHLDLDRLLERKFIITALATAGVVISTLVVGGVCWFLFGLFGIRVPLGYCLIFGALISPTDPVAVMGLLKTVKAPPSLEAKIAGESLFNDGVGVVLFLLLCALFLGEGGAHGGRPGVSSALLLFFREVGGGVFLGFLFGYAAYAAMKSIDHYRLEVIISLALVMDVYALASALHCSGPIAVVVAGLFIGNHGRRFAMSDATVDHMEKFWGLLDEVLNSLLFLLIGFEVFLLPLGETRLVEAAILAIPVVLFARFTSVSLPVLSLSPWRRFTRGVIPILTWSGLRGGISVALVLSLAPRLPVEAGNLFLLSTYFVVLFSVIVQGLTVRPLLRRYLGA